MSLIHGTILLLLVVGLSGCVDDDIENSDDEIQNIDFEGNIGTGKGEIQYINLEGGFYGIISGDRHYDPINLPLDFEEDGLQVEFKLKILENATSSHMWGTIVEILEIKKR